MFEFQNPAAFFMLLLIPLLYILRLLKIFSKITYPAVLADWNGKVFEYKGKFRKFLSNFAKFLIAASFIFAVAAFADPVKISQEKVYTSIGTDVMFVIDTSPSMAAKDVNNMTRLGAAKDAISTLMTDYDGLRYGLAAFGSSACVYVPPTHNYQVFNEQFQNLPVGILGNGSAIGDGLSSAVCHLASSSAPQKCIVLLTDGENNAGEIHPETAAKLATENNITLYVVGVGSRGTVPIEYTDPVSGKIYSGYLDSDFNPAGLKKIAAMGNGRYFEVRTIDELKGALNSVVKNESVIQNFTYRSVTTDLYKNFILISIILILTSSFISYIILQEKISFHYKKLSVVRIILLGFSFVMLILAYCGFSWGTYLEPVQKSGTAVSFVFDISHSMKAKDGPNGCSRMQASATYAEKLLSRMDGTSVSVVLAKGDGIAAIPLTEDKAMIESLISALSSDLMTSPGTNLAKGILKAKESFPKNFANAGRIWLFTDGEETSGNLATALEDCIKSGIPVTIIGFGKNKETEILAGDGKTYVKTALRENAIQKAIDEATSKLSIYKTQTPLTYLNSTDQGSAIFLLNQLKNNSGGENQLVTYETKPVPRYKLFVVFALLAFAFSYICTEFDFKRVFGKRKLSSTLSLMIFLALFTGCSDSTFEILTGSHSIQQKQYRKAISHFMNSLQTATENENQENIDYSLYNLGTAYQLSGEKDAAMNRYGQISENASENVKFAAYYNSGIIAHSQEDYELAQDFFRKALEVDNTKVNAKINLELSMQMAEAKGRQRQSQTIPAAEENSSMPDIEEGVFEHVKENDQKRWKNSESPENSSLENDY